jgi:hypothetical protein
MMHEILMALAPVFFVMALGYVAGKRARHRSSWKSRCSAS